MNDFTAGDKVVCVDDRWDAVTLKLYTALPVKDRVYVVREVRLGIRTDCRTGDLSVLLIGLVNPISRGRTRLEFGFSADRFRKLDELKTRTRESEPEPEREYIGKEVETTVTA